MTQVVYSQASLFSSLQPFSDDHQDDASWLEVPIDTADFIVLDLETTGLSAKRNSITEITAIRYRNGIAGEKYSTLVKPHEPIPPEVEDLTGITNDMVRNAPPVVMVLNELLEFTGASPVLVGHNVSFDINFLRTKCQDTGLLNGEYSIRLEKAFCTKVLAQRYFPDLPSYEGLVVATQCGYYNDNPHRAEADVRMSGAILFTLINKLRQDGIPMETLSDLYSFQGSLN